MEQREIEFIAEQEWKRYQEWRKDPKNAKVVNFADRIYHDLNELGYDIQWGFTMQPTVFNGDNRIFPICQKYIEEAENDEELTGCLNMTIGILGHRKMRIATEYLLNKYREAIKRGTDTTILDSYAWTIWAIRDERYIADYLELINPKKIIIYSSFFVDLMWRLKVYEAEDLLIELVDHRSGTISEMTEKYLYDMGLNLAVSESAIKALGFLKCKKAIPVIEKYLHPETLPGFFPNDKRRKSYITEFRNLARKTIERINR